MKSFNIYVVLAVAVGLIALGSFTAARAETAKEAIGASEAGQVICTLHARFVEKVDLAVLFNRLATGMDRRLKELGHSVPYFGALVFKGDQAGDTALLDGALSKLARSKKCKATSSQLLIAGLKYMMASFKDHGTKFFEPGEYSPSLEEMGYNIGGCGFYVDNRPVPEGGFICFMVIKGFPAEKVGIRPGDRLIRVDNQDVTKMNFEQLAGLVRGPIGTNVALVMARAGEKEPLEFVIKRTWLSPNTTSYDLEILDGKTAHLHLRYLGKHVELDIRELLGELKKKGVERLVLDLRNDEGDMDGALALAGLFLPKGTPVVDKVYRESVETCRSTEEEAVGMPVAVLVNRYTSSSATILAGALQDAKAARVVGAPTYWGDSIKEPEEIKGCMFTVTRGYYRLPSGRIFRNEGDSLVPDVTVPQGPFAQADPAADRQLQKALKLLQEK